MTLSVNLGDEYIIDAVTYRVVRIVNQDALFESEDSGCEVVSEHLLELKGSEGQIEFVVLSSERKMYNGAESKIKAPEPINWKRN